MRLSTERNDPGFHPQACLARVYLAGSQRQNVVTADEERRWAKLYRLDEHGRIVVKDGHALTEDFWGDVRIELPPAGLIPFPPQQESAYGLDC